MNKGRRQTISKLAWAEYSFEVGSFVIGGAGSNCHVNRRLIGFFWGKAAIRRLAVDSTSLFWFSKKMEQTAFLVRRHRTDDSHQGWENAVRACEFAVGQRVRIVAGPLAGLNGVLTAQAEDRKWVLEAAELGRGVLICVRAPQLARSR